MLVVAHPRPPTDEAMNSIRDACSLLVLDTVRQQRPLRPHRLVRDFRVHLQDRPPLSDSLSEWRSTRAPRPTVPPRCGPPRWPQSQRKLSQQRESHHCHPKTLSRRRLALHAPVALLVQSGVFPRNLRTMLSRSILTGPLVDPGPTPKLSRVVSTGWMELQTRRRSRLR